MAMKIAPALSSRQYLPDIAGSSGTSRWPRVQSLKHLPPPTVPFCWGAQDGSSAKRGRRLRQHARYSVGALGEGRLAYSSHSPRTESNRSSGQSFNKCFDPYCQFERIYSSYLRYVLRISRGTEGTIYLDELFSEISIIEDARQHELLRVRKNQIDQSNAALVLGLRPR